MDMQHSHATAAAAAAAADISFSAVLQHSCSTFAGLSASKFAFAPPKVGDASDAAFSDVMNGSYTKGKQVS